MKYDYVCSVCRKKAISKSEDNVFLVCGCDKGVWVSSSKGGYYSNVIGAKPILNNEDATQEIEVIKVKRKQRK